MRTRKFIIISIVLLFLFSFLGKSFASQNFFWKFKDNASLKDWNIKNSEDYYIESNELAVLAKKEAVFISPSSLNLPYSFSIFEIKLTLEHSDIVHILWQGMDVNYTPLPNITFLAEKGENTYFINLNKNKYWEKNISQFAIVFQNGNQKISIGYIKFVKPNFAYKLSIYLKEFLYPETLRQSSINVLNGPYLFGHSFLSYFYILFFAVFILKIFLTSRKEKNHAVIKRNIISSLFIFTVIFWGIYDLRITYNQAIILTDTYKDFVSPKKEDKRFFELGDFYNFLDFAKKNIENGKKVSFFPYSPWPFGTRAVYFLFPIRIFENEENLTNIDYLLTYKNRDIIDEENKLILITKRKEKIEKKVLSASFEKIASFDNYSVIYKINK